MLVGEQSPAPRVVAGLRKLRPELTPGPVPTPTDPNIRISGVLRQYYNEDTESWAWVRAAVQQGCLLAWRDGTLPRRPAARLPLRDLHLRIAPTLPNAFQLSRLRDDSSVATFQTCNAAEYAKWVRALCVEILGQTPLPQVRFLDVLPAADTTRKPKNEAPQQETPACPPRAPPRARRRLLTSPETQLPRRDHSPAATDEGIVVEDDDYDSSSDRSLDLTFSLDALKTTDVVDAPPPVRKAEVIKCDNCSKLTAQHHTLPRARSTDSEQGRHRYLKRWEGTAGAAERGRFAMEAARRKTASLESRARSCSPNAHEAVAKYVPVRERRALFESLSKTGSGLARSTEQLTRPIVVPETTPRRAASLHDLQAPPTRSVSDLRQFFEAVARGVGGCSAGLQRHSAPPNTAPRAFASLTCA
ncbi:uncharacterized protein LOC128675467 [Plodia interpunctella]|uniref:uncharacterized protein LOC128675467 n=1 Tax=Plodia interpunctella TaxID=58824 RepID=UPI0023689774|nr:uncharacterized protein LOC128675467 [Plodia interpunctella]